MAGMQHISAEHWVLEEDQANAPALPAKELRAEAKPFVPARSFLPAEAPRSTGVSESSPEVSDYYIEQHLVGRVLGHKGGSLREVEFTHQVQVVIDQKTKNMGYSSVRIVGCKDAIARSVKQIEASLALVSSRPGPFLKDEPPSADDPSEIETIHVDQRFVGWIVGKRGIALRSVEAASGCKITINQETQNLGYSTLIVTGSNAQRAVAKQKLNAAIQRAAHREANVEELMQVLPPLPPVPAAQQSHAASPMRPPPGLELEPDGSVQVLPPLPPVPAAAAPPAQEAIYHWTILFEMVQQLWQWRALYRSRISE